MGDGGGSVVGDSVVRDIVGSSCSSIRSSSSSNNNNKSTNGRRVVKIKKIMIGKGIIGYEVMTPYGIGIVKDYRRKGNIYTIQLSLQQKQQQQQQQQQHEGE